MEGVLRRLEGPGWNDLMGSWVDERMALKLQERPSGFFCDSELRAFERLDDTDVISDEARVSYARERISEWAEGEDGYLCPSVHCFPIGGLWGPYSALKTTLRAEIDPEAWATLNSDTSRPFDKPKSGRVAVKVINHLGDEVMKVFRV